MRSGNALGAVLAITMLTAAGGLAAALSGTDTTGTAAVPMTNEAGARLWYPRDSNTVLTLPGDRTETIQSVLNIRRPMKYGDFVWDEAGVPKGRIWVRADLDRQIISVFRAGNEIGTAVILYGADGKPTPTGVFPVLEKSADYHSRTYDDAPMPYTLRLTADGVAIHGSDVRERAATHGCIGVPLEFARRLFEQVRPGDEVFVVKAA